MRIFLIAALGVIFFLVLQSLWQELKRKRPFLDSMRSRVPELGRAYFSAPFLELGINWRTSVLEGIIRSGILGMERGQSLNALSQEKIFSLYSSLKQRSCHKSCELVRVYLLHRFPHSPASQALAREQRLQKPLEASGGHLTLREAYYILGVPKGADASTVRSAHRQLTKKLHPDRPEGSVYLTTQLNLARDLLLKKAV